MTAHTHITQGKTDGCPACDPIRPDSQVHPSLVPSLPAAYTPTTFELEPDDDDPKVPEHVDALPDGMHRIVDGRAVCIGDIGHKCHWYPNPDECTDESWPCGHEYVFNEACWLMSWLDAVDLEDTAEDSALEARIGDDLVWPNGDIDWEWHGDYVTWSYARIDPNPEPVVTPPDGRRASDVPLWDD